MPCETNQSTICRLRTVILLLVGGTGRSSLQRVVNVCRNESLPRSTAMPPAPRTWTLHPIGFRKHTTRSPWEAYAAHPGSVAATINTSLVIVGMFKGQASAGVV